MGKRKPTGAVEIDWNNPITRGLKVCLTPLNRQNVVNGEAPTVTGSPDFTINDGKQVVDFGRETDQYTLEYGGISAQPSEFTVVCFGRNWFDQNLSLKYINAACHVCSNRSSGNGGFTYTIMGDLYDNDGKGRVTFQGVADYDSTSRTILGSGFHSHAVAVDSSGTARFFTNGEFKYSTAVGALASGDPVLYVGKQGNISAYGYEIIENLFYWERKLSDAEIARIEANPYQLLKPANDAPWLQSVDVAAGPQTYTGTGALTAGAAAIAGTSPVMLTDPLFADVADTTATVGCTVTGI